MVLGAPRERLAVGEVPAVERSEAPAIATAAAAAATAATAAAASAEPSAAGVGINGCGVGGGGGGGAGSPPASRRGCRLLAGQYFGEKGLLRQAEVSVCAWRVFGWWVLVGLAKRGRRGRIYFEVYT